MLLKSASTPVLQTLLSSSFSESTLRRDHFNSHHTTTNKNKSINNNGNNKNPLILDPNASRLSFSNQNNNLTAPCLLSQTSSGSPKFNEQKPSTGSRNSFRRAFSDSSLGDLLTSSSSNISPSIHFPSFQQKPRKVMLQSAPSFSIYDVTKDGVQRKEEKEKGNNGKSGESSLLTRSVTIGDAGSDFSFVEPNMELIREEEGEGEEEEEEEGAVNWKDGGSPSPPMYLAAGLGVDDDESIFENFLEGEKVEEYYRNLVEEYPSHPLILRNYAQLLQSKGDYHGAEDYYFRATVADDGDGEILSQYAKLVWDLHHDQEKASAYFERAAQAAPQDSYVLAAYASFLWEVDSNRDSDSANQARAQIELKQEGNLCSESNTMTEKAQRSLSPSVCLTEGTVNGIAGNNGKGNLTTGGPSESANAEDYYERMVEADPSNPLFLRNYAHFLYQCKGDLRGAEEYYSRAILADPQDGEILSKYANLVWELYQDKSKASNYFEQAVQVAPTDSNVLAAYARFLWAIGDDDEEEVAPVNTVQIAVPGGVVASASL
ncbi:hypothetical protein Ancab_013629 [Ancistrocladus abbreviatus]